jgi:hypothetical protein
MRNGKRCATGVGCGFASRTRIFDWETLERLEARRDCDRAHAIEAAVDGVRTNFYLVIISDSGGAGTAAASRRSAAAYAPSIFQRLRLFERRRVLLRRFITVRAATSLARRP